MERKVPYGFVYETINMVNGMKYIGKCIYHRQNSWRTYLGSGLYLKRAIAKYGKNNFKRRILCQAYSDEELNILEEQLIKMYDAVESSLYYNIKLTSIGGDTFITNPHKEITRELKRQHMSGKKNHQYGKAKTPHMIASVKEANNRAVMIEGITYRSQSEAARCLNMNVTTINYRLDSDAYPTWERVVPKNKVIRKVNNHPTCTVEIDGVIYSSIKEASYDIGVSVATTIRRLDNNEFPTYKRLSERLR
ncbi:hypothetical protein [Priestia taiwanensis]|uniref:GIY-YIG domain-containing protein n=1 Tax=Priestia taiwanensis TaxID=1347902 RepID=A0A917ARS9_9BACI|nr:hypothetical protein [Priestia taiwanensis]MBM7363960.1 group I intron endonuclease [Priestia taiwanensis]GGE70512.1 hypothetical protein GCM10007140_20510 [Priestia taiwanensis]